VDGEINMVQTYKKKDGVDSIQVRLLEIKNGAWVIKMDEQHKDGYYEFLIDEDELAAVLASDNQKWTIYKHLAVSYNRSFMEFLMNDLQIERCYLASIYIDYPSLEFSYLETEYMDETHLSDYIDAIYSEEIGMMSDFDYYPYGLVVK
jgi:hypothetical protein